MPPLKALIDLSAFRHNLNETRKIIGPSVGILPVIKANGYGHGVLPLAEECLKFGVPALGLGLLEEGIELRKAKVAAPIILLDGIFKEQAADAVKFKLTPVVFSMDIVRELNRLGRNAGRKIAIHLKFDTGMSRIGFGFDESDDILRKVARMKNVVVEGIMTHLASSNDGQSPQTELQLKRFEDIVDLSKEVGLEPKWIHAANSGAILNFKESFFSMVRPGIILYGAPPVKLKKSPFKQVMTLKSRIISVKNVPAGEGVGYGATYITPRKKRVGVVIGGYADGVNRLLSNRAAVSLRKKLVPVLGVVCMDNFMIDLSRVPSARVGDEVTIMGGAHAVGPHAELSVDTWAELAGTIPYEIFCRIGNRVERVFS